jgi:hypothetical protein
VSCQAQTLFGPSPAADWSGSWKGRGGVKFKKEANPAGETWRDRSTCARQRSDAGKAAVDRGKLQPLVQTTVRFAGIFWPVGPASWLSRTHVPRLRCAWLRKQHRKQRGPPGAKTVTPLWRLAGMMQIGNLGILIHAFRSDTAAQLSI